MNCKTCKNSCDCKEREAFEKLDKLGGGLGKCSGYEPYINNEIIKALECCGTGDFCNHCKYQDLRDCHRHLAKDVLNLFDCLQAENERLEEDIKAQDSSIKSLTSIVNSNYQNGKADGKVEAYKEFAERLKQVFYNDEFIFTRNIIDNLLKELVGE